jgi:hypothetical protein
MFERGGGSFLQARGAIDGATQIPLLAKDGAGNFVVPSALQLTNKPTETGPSGGAAITVTRTGNTLSIAWTPAGGTLESSTSLGATANWTPVGSANPATITIGNGQAVFYRVRQ